MELNLAAYEPPHDFAAWEQAALVHGMEVHRALNGLYIRSGDSTLELREPTFVGDWSSLVVPQGLSPITVVPLQRLKTIRRDLANTLGLLIADGALRVTNFAPTLAPDPSPLLRPAA